LIYFAGSAEHVGFEFSQNSASKADQVTGTEALKLLSEGRLFQEYHIVASASAAGAVSGARCEAEAVDAEIAVRTPTDSERVAGADPTDGAREPANVEK
jgi:hypothetical protein